MASSPIADLAFRRKPVPRASGLSWGVLDALERIAAAAGLVLSAPILLAAAAVVFGLCRRSPFVAHMRVGLHGSRFWTLKLRTMWPDGETWPAGFRLVEYIDDDNGPARKRPEDPRITSAFARFCRRFSIDELPQLLHVARGEMSLVGPRPLTAGELREHYGLDAAAVLGVKPGITGLWQVMGRNTLTYRQRRRLDLYFVRNRTPGLYLWILARTVPVVLLGRGCY